jgi:hypothetical protein
MSSATYQVPELTGLVAQLLARHPNLTSVGDGAPVVVAPSEISEAPGIDTLPVLVHVTVPPGTVQVSAVLALPTRSVNVRESVKPGATESVTARSLAVIVAFGVNELTMFSFALAAARPEGAMNHAPVPTALPRPSTAAKAGLPADPFGPWSPRGPCGRLLDLKSPALSDLRFTFAPVTAFAPISELLTAPFRSCFEPTLFFGSESAA